MLAWWAYQDEEQELMSLETTFEIEHIFAKNRQEKENSLKDPKSLELLGNKVLLEKRINIRASDYRFEDKKKYYNGSFTSRGEKKVTQVHELKVISEEKYDFTESDIIVRNTAIIGAFIDYMKANGLID